MSWLSEFTSKAENLLTKFDQTAAQTLNESSFQNNEENVAALHQGNATSPSSPPETLNNKEYQNASHLFSSQPKQTTQVTVGESAVSSGIILIISLFLSYQTKIIRKGFLYYIDCTL